MKPASVIVLPSRFLIRLILGMAFWTFIAGVSQAGITRTPVGGYLNGIFPDADPSSSRPWRLENAFSNDLVFENPMGFVPVPNDETLYVIGKNGMVWLLDDGFDEDTKTVALDITANTKTISENGLQSIALHPEFGDPTSPNRGYLYLIYTTHLGSNRPPSTSFSGRWRLSRFTVTDPSVNLTIEASSELVLVEQFINGIHHGGALFFGPQDGFLYFSLGDSSDLTNTQQIDRGLYSGIFRVDVDMDPLRSHPIPKQPNYGTTAHYFIPNDNPFVGEPGALEEFFALGLRNPYRVTADPQTGEIYCGDVGGNLAEEINLIVPGGNYQWPYKEGGSITNRIPIPDPIIGSDQGPLISFGRTVSTAMIGGFVYRGAAYQEDLEGKYLFADYVTGIISTLEDPGSGDLTVASLAEAPLPPPTNPREGAVIVGFSQDHSGEVYVHQLDSAGKIYRLVKNEGSGPVFPQLLSETGAFLDTANLTPSPVMVPYEVNSPLWSDRSLKKRWAILPNDGPPYIPAVEQAVWSEKYEWFFPSGSVFVKHFELPIDETNPSVTRRLETRFLVMDGSGGAYGITYRWREDQSDAELVDFDGFEEEIEVTTSTGVRRQTWSYPSTNQCMQCHTSGSRYVLGANTRQLNGETIYPGSVTPENQLEAWSLAGLINAQSAGTIASSPSLSDLDDPVSLEEKVRSYLDANCAHCHQPEGVRALFDARYDTPLVAQGLVNGKTAEPSSNKILRPGDPAGSLLFQRLSTLGPGQMPPLAKNQLHDRAIQELQSYLQNLNLDDFLPDGWEQIEIGPSFTPGLARYQDGKLELSSAGFPGSTRDQMLFVHRSASTDFDLRVRVGRPRLSGVNNILFAGLMLRDNLSEGAPTYYLADTGQRRKSVRLAKRPSQNVARSLATLRSGHYPHFRITRNGGILRSYYSTNGNNWILGDETDGFFASSDLEVGVFLAGHTESEKALNSMTFDQLQLVEGDVSVVATDAIAIEGGIDHGRFQFRRTGPLDDSLTVNLVWSGAGANTGDVLDLPSSILFQAGEEVATVAIVALEDSIPEVGEAVTVTVASDSRFGSQSPSATVGVGATAFEAWRAIYFDGIEMSDPAISGEDADPDGDELSNVQEFVLETDPTKGQRNPIEMWIEEGLLHLKYPQSLYAELAITVEGSSTLQAGDWLERPMDRVSLETIGSRQWTTLRDPSPVESGDRLFLRLKISGNLSGP